jgi:hypothetical protein
MGGSDFWPFFTARFSPSHPPPWVVLMIDWMIIYVHDYFVLDLSLLYYLIKHRGIHLDEIMRSFSHWLYDFA